MKAQSQSFKASHKALTTLSTEYYQCWSLLLGQAQCAIPRIDDVKESQSHSLFNLQPHTYNFVYQVLLLSDTISHSIQYYSCKVSPGQDFPFPYSLWIHWVKSHVFKWVLLRWGWRGSFSRGSRGSLSRRRRGSQPAIASRGERSVPEKEWKVGWLP